MSKLLTLTILVVVVVGCWSLATAQTQTNATKVLPTGLALNQSKAALSLANLTISAPNNTFIPTRLSKLSILNSIAANEKAAAAAAAAALNVTGNTTDTTDTTMSPAVKPIVSSKKMLKAIHDYLIVMLLVSVMFAMGCSITWKQVWEHVRNPVGVLIGMLSQFVLLPFSAFILIIVFRIDPLHATGLLILACSPGGVTSNIFAYFCDGDLSLSVTMTSFSTVVALFMMPFNMWLYGQNLETESLVIPYSKMTVSLVSLSTPVVVGMWVKWRFPRWAPLFTQAGSVAGFAIIVICQTLEVFIFPDIFNNVPAVLYAAEFLLPFLGLALGFGAASVFKLPYSIRRTIAIEAGIQNVGTALTIITLSFPFEQLKKVWLFPFMYAFSMLAVCCVVAIVYRVFRFYNNQKKLGINKKMVAANITINSEVVRGTKV